VEIVGVAQDARYSELRGKIQPTLYLADEQYPDQSSGGIFTIKTAIDPEILIPAVRQAMCEIDPNLAAVNQHTQESQIDDSL
jgi:hypothetical protein